MVDLDSILKLRYKVAIFTMGTRYDTIFKAMGESEKMGIRYEARSPHGISVYGRSDGYLVRLYRAAEKEPYTSLTCHDGKITISHSQVASYHESQALRMLHSKPYVIPLDDPNSLEMLDEAIALKPIGVA